MTAKHLIFLETWTNDLPVGYHGVDPVRCTSYELIQLLNRAYLAERLAAS